MYCKIEWVNVRVYERARFERGRGVLEVSVSKLREGYLIKHVRPYHLLNQLIFNGKDCLKKRSKSYVFLYIEKYLKVIFYVPS